MQTTHIILLLFCCMIINVFTFLIIIVFILIRLYSLLQTLNIYSPKPLLITTCSVKLVCMFTYIFVIINIIKKKYIAALTYTIVTVNETEVFTFYIFMKFKYKKGLNN